MNFIVSCWGEGLPSQVAATVPAIDEEVLRDCGEHDAAVHGRRDRDGRRRAVPRVQRGDRDEVPVKPSLVVVEHLSGDGVPRVRLDHSDSVLRCVRIRRAQSCDLHVLCVLPIVGTV